MAKTKFRTVLKQTRLFRLVKQERAGKKTWYEIEYFGFVSTLAGREESMQQANDIAALMDPTGLKTFRKTGVVPKIWRFWKLEEADQLFTMAALRWTI